MEYRFDEIEMLIEGQQWDNNSPRELLQYAVGALLYTPAAHEKIGQVLCDQRYGHLKTIALCLEDSIQSQELDLAEERLLASLQEVAEAVAQGRLEKSKLPLIFIRVRNPWQIETLFVRMKSIADLVTGFVAPKFDASNMRMYGEVMTKINSQMTERPMYLMPILESTSVISIETRAANLLSVKSYLDTISQWILNIRVGGNDFCNELGLRRSKEFSIYDLGVIQNVLMDILNVFGRDYVVSAPVWEYFGDDKETGWLVGLTREMALDRMNGFIGKTAIHPSQLLPIQQSLVVADADYQDALQVAGWQDSVLAVHKGVKENRMNEAKVHQRWAKKVLALANIYGVRKDY